MTDGYRLVLASDVSERDGLGLELYRPDGTLIAEVFRDDSSGQRTFIAHDAFDAPIHVVEWFLDRSRAKL